MTYDIKCELASSMAAQAYMRQLCAGDDDILTEKLGRKLVLWCRQHPPVDVVTMVSLKVPEQAMVLTYASTTQIGQQCGMVSIRNGEIKQEHSDRMGRTKAGAAVCPKYWGLFALSFLCDEGQCPIELGYIPRAGRTPLQEAILKQYQRMRDSKHQAA